MRNAILRPAAQLLSGAVLLALTACSQNPHVLGPDPSIAAPTTPGNGATANPNPGMPGQEKQEGDKTECKKLKLVEFSAEEGAGATLVFNLQLPENEKVLAVHAISLSVMAKASDLSGLSESPRLCLTGICAPMPVAEPNPSDADTRIDVRASFERRDWLSLVNSGQPMTFELSHGLRAKLKSPVLQLEIVADTCDGKAPQAETNEGAGQ